MSSRKTQPEYVGRREELLAELFLQDLKPASLARTTEDFGFDFLLTFANSAGGVTMYGVEVKSTESPVQKAFALPLKVARQIANSNLPVLLLIVDVKQNRFYYAWPETVAEAISGVDKGTVAVPVIEVTENIKNELRQRLSRGTLIASA